MSLPRVTVLLLVVSACGTPAPAGPTFHRDVAPLVQAQCTGCHVAGGIAPFALDTFEAARPMAAAMAQAVAARRMPPWLATQDCGTPFVDARVLTDEQIAVFDAWAKAGAPEGSKADAPASPAPTSQRLKRVDATLAMSAPYTPGATLRDDYRCFVIDPQLATSRLVTATTSHPAPRRWCTTSSSTR